MELLAKWAQQLYDQQRHHLELFAEEGDVAVQSASDATRVSAFSEAFTEAVIGGEVTQVAARRLPM